MKAEKFSYQLQVKEHHLDSLGHMNNAVYLQLYEEARWDFITKNGFGIHVILEKRIAPVLLEVHVKFKKEVKNREWITIESVCLSLKKDLLMEIEQTMYNEQKQITSVATFIVGVMDLEKRQLLKPSADWLKAIGVEI